MKILNIQLSLFGYFLFLEKDIAKLFETGKKKQSIHKVESYKLYILFEFCSVSYEVQYEQHSSPGLFLCLALVWTGNSHSCCQYLFPWFCFLVLGWLRSRSRSQPYPGRQDETTQPTPLYRGPPSPARVSHPATTPTLRVSARSTITALTR